jgi:hypothetical protein
MFIRPFRLGEFSYYYLVMAEFSLEGRATGRVLKKNSTEDILKTNGRFFTLKPSDQVCYWVY